MMDQNSTSTDRTETTSVTASDKERADASVQSQSKNTPPPSPKPPKGPRVWVIAMVFVTLMLGFTAGSFWGPAVANRAQHFLQSTSNRDHEHATTQPNNAEAPLSVEFFSCGMHPWVILPEPGLCPICHMDLTPLDPDKFTGEISIDPVVTQNIGVRVEPVSLGPVVRTIRTVGTVAFDETRVRDVNIKVPGWIETLYVDYVGARVRSEDPLFEFYSPKLYSAQSEYLAALQMRGKVGVDFLPDTKMDVERLVADARVQLEFYDITPEQIEALQASGEPAKTMTIRSPHDGIVIAKHANEGMRVDQGMRVYQIADLSKVWVMVSLYEYQLPFVQVGQQATMRLPYIPGQTFEGQVIYIYPYLDEKTRQVRVRLEFENPNTFLKPGMYASIELRSTLARERTIAPRSAVIDTGERQIAFVSLGEGRFEPRDVRMGVETEGGLVEIIDGLSPGEMVVTSGQFLLDSEARIRESLAKMIKGNLALEQKAVVEVVGISELASLPAGVSAGISSALQGYFQIGDLLASDKTTGLAQPARAVAQAVDDLLHMEIPDDPHFWHRHDEIATVRGKALEIAGATDIATARLAFADMSVALVKLVKATGIPPTFDVEVQQLHCPMYREGQGGSIWIQPSGDVRNPFFGAIMLECFDERTALPVTGQSADGISPSSKSSSKELTDNADSLATLSPDAQAAIDSLVRAYLTIQDKLTRDDMEGTNELLDDMHGALDRLESSVPDSIASLVARVHDVRRLDRTNLKTLRQGFRGLSDTMIELVRSAPPSQNVASTVYHVYCPMEKAHWLQTSSEVTNPYVPYMLRCGSIKETFAANPVKGILP